MPDPVREVFDSRRRLCPDGACVGVIGADRRCSVCGMADSGAEQGLGPEAFATFPKGAEPRPGVGFAEGDDADGALDTAGAELGGGEGTGFDAKRGLCPDGACIGVLGGDGRCKVCGKSAGG